MVKAKLKLFGSIRFITQLIKLNIISILIVQSIFKMLFDHN